MVALIEKDKASDSSDTSNALSTSIPKYLTVLSNFESPRFYRREFYLSHAA